jgi:hypothetical protein
MRILTIIIMISGCMHVELADKKPHNKVAS